MSRVMIDLHKCVAGDKLISCHGLELTYLKLEEGRAFPHTVKYPSNALFGENSEGSRLDNGQVYGNRLMALDHDIVIVVRDGEVIQRAENTLPYDPTKELQKDI